MSFISAFPLLLSPVIQDTCFGHPKQRGLRDKKENSAQPVHAFLSTLTLVQDDLYIRKLLQIFQDPCLGAELLIRSTTVVPKQVTPPSTLPLVLINQYSKHRLTASTQNVLHR